MAATLMAGLISGAALNCSSSNGAIETSKSSAATTTTGQGGAHGRSASNTGGTTSTAGNGGALPFKDCPETCMAHTCKWSGDGGPGWDDTWTADPKPNHPTENGVCTQHCVEYESAKWLCGAHEWHKGTYGERSVDCTGCALPGPFPFAPKPATPEEEASLCGQAGMTKHITWGTALVACDISKDECTVYQSLNGDAVINPGRTCRDFCSHFGLVCVNGYDDGGDGCLYGGEGIGCDSVLGCCSEGGPTPDHVCTCKKP